MVKRSQLPKEIYFDEKAGSNGVHCLDYKNESSIKYIRDDVFDQQLSAERERGQQFPTTEQMDAAINVSIGKMFGGLEAESIKYFLQTSKINGSFRRRLHDCIKSASMLVDIKAKTELLKERERAGKLVEAIELVTSLGYVSDILTKPLNEYKQTLNEYDPKK